MPAALLAAVLVLGSGVAAHNRSEGRARFVLEESGRLDVKITLSTLDMPELCNLDLSTTNEGLRAERLSQLDVCVRRDLPRLLRATADAGTACPVLVERTGVERMTVSIDAIANCPRLPDERLRVDWGLFAGTPLDHVAVTTFEQPHDKPKLVLLSKRQNKLVVDVAHPVWPTVAAAGAAALLVLVAGIALVVVRRRRGRRTLGA